MSKDMKRSLVVIANLESPFWTLEYLPPNSWQRKDFGLGDEKHA